MWQLHDLVDRILPHDDYKVKKDAGKRSGLRRSAKKALVVKKKTGMLETSGPIS